MTAIYRSFKHRLVGFFFTVVLILTGLLAQAQELPTKTPEATVVLGIDLTGSMMAKLPQLGGRSVADFVPGLIDVLVKQLPSRTHVVAYVICRNPRLVFESDRLGRNTRNELLNAARTQTCEQPGSSIRGFHLETAQFLQHVKGPKAVVLISDGIEAMTGHPVSSAWTSLEALCGISGYLTVGLQEARVPGADISVRQGFFQSANQHLTNATIVIGGRTDLNATIERIGVYARSLRR